MENEQKGSSRRAFFGCLIRSPLVPVAVLAVPAAESPPTTAQRRVLMNDFPIAGFRYYDGPDELPELAVGTVLTLRAQPTNAYDRFAVEIFHGALKLGYVPRFCNRHLSRLLLEGVPLSCVVESVDPNALPSSAVAVRVYLVERLLADDADGEKFSELSESEDQACQ